MKVCNLKICGIGKPAFLLMAVLLLSSILFVFLPVDIAKYSSFSAGTLTPFGPITSANSLDYCVDGPLRDINKIDLFTATYRRLNTNKNVVTVYSLLNGQKNVLTTQMFSSQNVPDNQYYTISFPPITETGKLCFQISSIDGTADNGITVWLNSFNDPVFRLKTTLPFYRALDYIRMANRMGLPSWLVVVISWVFLLASTAMLTALIIKSVHGAKKTSKSAHH